MLVVALLVLVPIVEIVVFVQVAAWIGVLEAFVLLGALALLGAWLLRHQGLAVYRDGRATVAAGRIPGRAIVDGALVVVAGVLILVPGFVTAALGLLLLVPVARGAVRDLLVRRWSRSARARTVTIEATSRMRSDALELGGGGTVEPGGEAHG